MAAAKKINLGLVGFGTVGSGVWQLLQQQSALLSHRIGADIIVRSIVVRSQAKKRRIKVPKAILKSDWKQVVQDPEIHIIVELTGDVESSRRLALETIRAGKHFVTANKALLASHGAEIFQAAEQAGVSVCFEAAVAGGIPVLRALREGFAGNRILSLYGIVNGTCNYILTEMAEKNSAFQETLQDAQKLGYAEANPTFDVDGIDAAHKLSILVAIAYGVELDLNQIHTEGIRQVSPLDLKCAHQFGYAIKLLAIAKRAEDSRIQVRVHPTMIPQNSMLAAVRGVYNAVFIDGDYVGKSMLYGRGAGSAPTASAVVGDIVELARQIVAGAVDAVPPLGVRQSLIRKVRLEPLGELKSAYYLRFQALDCPGVLAKITQVLSRYQISISSVYQHGREENREVPIVILTHEALEKNVQKAIAVIDRLKEIQKPTTLIRIEEEL